jgi:hypothetical protein
MAMVVLDRGEIREELGAVLVLGFELLADLEDCVGGGLVSRHW